MVDISIFSDIYRWKVGGMRISDPCGQVLRNPLHTYTHTLRLGSSSRATKSAIIVMTGVKALSIWMNATDR